MIRDPYISKLIRESGMTQVRSNFTLAVMNRIELLPVKQSYKPLLGLGGRILIILFFLVVVVISILYSDPGGEIFSNTVKLPQLNINLDFLKQVNISTGLISALAAMFLLVILDAGLNRQRFT